MLGNGFRIHADRHETGNGAVRLFSNGGVTEMRAGLIDRFEKDDAPEPAPSLETPVTVPAPVAIAPAAPTVKLTAEQLAAQAAKKYSLPESFVRSVMRVESGFHQEALSPKGAMGLMQLMPETARVLGVDAKNAKENAEGGAQYLRDLLARYEDRPDQVLLALAAYNAGPGAVERYHGVPPYRETRQYILKVLRYWDQSQKGN